MNHIKLGFSPIFGLNTIFCKGVTLSTNNTYLCARLRNNKTNTDMKQGIHPESYRKVVFRDISCNEEFITQSCAPSKETIKWTDGNEYPLVKVEISSASHPFFTGKMKFVDTAGRIEKFNKKFGKTKFGETKQ